jgi:hypothetical protein
VRIPKPLRQLLKGILPVDALDLWLRRRTRDPMWLMTNEGRAWLESEDGLMWVRRSSVPPSHLDDKIKSELSACWDRVGDHPSGPLIAVTFGGVYRPGSAGLEFGRAMIEFLQSTLNETNPAGVIIDLTALDYIWGDTIAGLAMPLLSEDKTRFRPAVIVAVGRTAQSLEPLLEPRNLLGLAGVKMVRTRQAAVAHLERALD